MWKAIKSRLSFDELLRRDSQVSKSTAAKISSRKPPSKLTTEDTELASDWRISPHVVQACQNSGCLKSYSPKVKQKLRRNSYSCHNKLPAFSPRDYHGGASADIRSPSTPSCRAISFHQDAPGQSPTRHQGLRLLPARSVSMSWLPPLELSYDYELCENGKASAKSEDGRTLETRAYSGGPPTSAPSRDLARLAQQSKVQGVLQDRAQQVSRSSSALDDETASITTHDIADTAVALTNAVLPLASKPLIEKSQVLQACNFETLFSDDVWNSHPVQLWRTEESPIQLTSGKP